MASVLEIRLLGEYQITRDGVPAVPLQSERIQSLLAYLLLHRRAPQPRLHLAFLLWPDSSETQARTNLRNLLHQLRRALPDADEFIRIEGLTLQWRDDALFTLDVADFQQALSQVKEAPNPHAARDALERAVAIYQGDLLPSSYEEWLLPLREELRQSFLNGLEQLALLLEEAGDYRAAIRHTQRLLQFEPLQEATYVHLMRLHARSGDRAGVLRVYQTCVSMLDRELGVEPSPTTREAYERLVRTEAAPPPPAPVEAEPPPPREAKPPSQPLKLPVQSTSFVGRKEELTELAALLASPECRLLTFVGPGGTGKTRLALQVAAQQAETLADGACLVSLASLASADLLVPSISSAVGLTSFGAADPTTQLLNHLRDRQMLLLLDNFEHLMAGADLLTEILQEAPGVKLLVTSRERLNLLGEWLFEVQGLPVPRNGHDTTEEESSALMLFVQSARRVRSGFALTAAERPHVIRICQLVEGMPLGIELAAAWARVLPAAEIAREIERNIDFLAASTRDTPSRHRSMRAIFDHSWRLLSDEEALALARLSLFRGGFRREAAQEVANAPLPMLAALGDKSLLRRVSSGRYDMHELVRQYALEKLNASGELDAIRDRYLAYYSGFVAEAAPQLQGAEQVGWLEQLEQELDNLRAALEWSFAANPPAPPERVERGLRAAASIYRFWQGRGHLVEGRLWLERGVYHPAAASTLTRASALDVLGWLINHFGQTELATSALQESLALFRQLGDRAGAATALDSLGDVAWGRGQFEQARTCYEESLALRRELGEPHSIGTSLYSFGRLYVDHGYNDEAATLLEEGMALLRAIGDQRGVALSLHGLGRVALNRADYPLAKRHVRAALELFDALGNKIDMAECLEVLALAAGAEGDPTRAARLLGASIALRETIGVTIPTIKPEAIAALRASLGEAAFTAAQAEGYAMPLQQAIAYALDKSSDAASS